MSHAARLFKTLVLTGTALGAGCGGRSERSGAGVGRVESGGAAGLGGSAGMAGTAGTANAGGVAVGGASECATAAQQFCSCSDGQFESECTLKHPRPSTRSISCRCDASAPDGPEDCAHTQQFSCLEYLPLYESCRCDPNAPLSEDDCPGDSQYFQCGAGEPSIDCQCITAIR